MTGADPLTFLFSLERLGMKFGLENMAALCEGLDHPEQSFRSVLIAGTNGKGSVTAIVEAALRAAGRHTGRYTSPHLERLEERFVIGGREVDTDALRAAAGRVQRAVETLLADRTLDTLPTFFECTTAIAFELFRSGDVELAVLEVGLGGRLDATNIVTPVCTAITSIALDHQAQLGDSIESIAREKAGIVKSGVPLVCGPVEPAADAVIAQVCSERGAPMRRAADHVRIEVQRPAGPAMVSFQTPQRHLRDVTLALDGRHQIDNAAVAVTVFDTLADIGIEIADGDVRTGLSSVDWPARLERVRWRNADVLLDAAHNPAGARALAAYLEGIGWKKVTLVFGVMQDKDASGMLAILAPHCERIVFTTPPTPRAMPAHELPGLAPVMSERLETLVVMDPAAAMTRAVALSTRVVVAGSLFLLGALRGILR